MATMKEITYAQAINDAMCEEMQRDENVFMMGEDIAEYCGAFGVSRGMLEKFGKDRIMNTPHLRAGLRRRRHRRGYGGHAPHRGADVLRLHVRLL